MAQGTYTITRTQTPHLGLMSAGSLETAWREQRGGISVPLSRALKSLEMQWVVASTHNGNDYQTEEACFRDGFYVPLQITPGCSHHPPPPFLHGWKVIHTLRPGCRSNIYRYCHVLSNFICIHEVGSQCNLKKLHVSKRRPFVNGNKITYGSLSVAHFSKDIEDSLI